MKPEDLVFAVIEDDGSIIVWFAKKEMFHKHKDDDIEQDRVDDVHGTDYGNMIYELCMIKGLYLNEIESGADGMSTEYVACTKDEELKATKSDIKYVRDTLFGLGFKEDKEYQEWANPSYDEECPE